MSKKDQYIEKAKEKLDQWNADIEKAQRNIDKSEADAKIKYQDNLDVMRKQRDEAEAWIKEMRDVEDGAWRDAKTGFDKAWDSMSGAFGRAVSHFK